MKTSPVGRALIETYEGFSPSAYLDQRGIPTIGYGHTLNAKMGDTCTPYEADLWLAEDLATAESAVNDFVKCPLNQNQFDALVSLAFNIGAHAFMESTVLKRLNLTTPPDIQGAATAFLLWDRVDGQVNIGLARRRRSEMELFLT